MENDIYRAVVCGLSELLGAAQPLVSGNGARFTSSRRGKATVYHNDLALGNRAEVAFHIESMAQRLGIGVAEFRLVADQWRQQTGCPVEVDQQHLWPRVGFSNIEQVSAILTLIHERSAQA
ncbi:hypothetical protein [Sedimenticola hydrogenitrophicus]|uniref:hypothetical protein n=1 Tax=Sedimenticola hydrogenitrophicus TaxID=2967975 RepID=UPI0023B0252A|nr:hypothetical protein [Sedimenticola hydrogenitrophicus]